MLKELKAKSMKRGMITAGILIAIALVLAIVMWFLGLHYLFGTKGNLDTMKDEEIGEMYAEGEIYAIMDYYAYTTEDSKTVEKEYFIPVGEESYIGLVAPKAYLEQCDKLMKETQDYMSGESDTISSTFRVKGTILPMESSSLKYYKEYYEELGWDDEETEVFLPYYLKIEYIGEYHNSFYYLVGVLAGALVIIAVCIILKNVSGANQKMIVKYCKKSGNYDATMAKLDKFYYSVSPVQGVRISPEFFMSPFGNSTLLLESKEILWAYQVTTTHRTNGIKTGTSYSLMLKLRSGKYYQVAFDGEQAVLQVLQYIENTIPFVIIGYTDELQKVYSKNRQEMIAEADRRIAEMQQQQEAWGFSEQA